MAEKILALHIMKSSETYTSVIRIGEFLNVDTFRKALKEVKNLLITCDKKYDFKLNIGLVRDDYFIIIK